MEVTQSIKLNINDTGNYCVVTVKQGDTGRKLNVTMMDGQTELFVPSSATVSVRVLKADGTSVDDAATVENGKAIVELTEQMTAVAGIAKADVSVASDGKIVSTATFLLKIGAVPMGVEIVSENEFTQLSTLIASASQYESRIEDLEAAVEGGAGGLSNEAKQALLDCFEHVAWVDEHGQDYVDALQVALYPPADLVGISAVYTQSGTVYDTDSLDDLKDDLVVTAHYSDSSSETVTTYTLSGTLTVGTSTITVSYGGKTTTFSVTVTNGRVALFGTFEAGAIGKGASNTANYRYMWKTSAAARARMSVPVANNGYVFTVTDSSKYNLVAYDPESLQTYERTVSGVGTVTAYYGGTKSIAWGTSDSVTTDYVWLALKKMDGTEFTAEELANGAEAVFTYTTS